MDCERAYRFILTLITIPAPFFSEIKNPKIIIHMKAKAPWLAEASLNKRMMKRSGGAPQDIKWRSHHTEFKATQAHNNENSCVETEINTDQCSGELWAAFSYLIFDKDAKNTHWRRDLIFIIWYWENLVPTCRRTKLDPFNYHHRQNQLRMDQQPHRRPTTLKCLEENVENTL